MYYGVTIKQNGKYTNCADRIETLRPWFPLKNIQISKQNCWIINRIGNRGQQHMPVDRREVLYLLISRIFGKRRWINRVRDKYHPAVYHPRQFIGNYNSAVDHTNIPNRLEDITFYGEHAHIIFITIRLKFGNVLPWKPIISISKCPQTVFKVKLY